MECITPSSNINEYEVINDKYHEVSDNRINIDSISFNGSNNIFTVQCRLTNISGNLKTIIQNRRQFELAMYKSNPTSRGNRHTRNPSKRQDLPYRGKYITFFLVNVSSTSETQFTLYIDKNTITEYRDMWINSKWSWEFNDIYQDYFFAPNCQIETSERRHPAINSDAIRIWYEL